MKNHIDGNKIIGEYLLPEWVLLKNSIYNGEIAQENLYIAALLCAEDYEHLNFHRSWEQLLRVYVKIKNYVDSTDWTITNNHGYDLFTLIQRFLLTADKDNVYDHIVLFIKWYNELQTK